uniref:Uncharacterized protein n=1 Tax=Glossina palpalis gambiensis TaxID=67801 RepID=A0A1B0BDH3_9MUSC
MQLFNAGFLHNVDFRLHCHNIKYNFRKKKQQQQEQEQQQQQQQRRRQKYILRDKCRFSSILLIWLNKPSRYDILQNICLNGNAEHRQTDKGASKQRLLYKLE